MTPRRRRFWSCLALLALMGVCDAALASEGGARVGGNDLHDGYLATISGTCEELVIGSRVVPICDDTLLNVDFANGRVAFVFAGRVDDASILTVLSGGASKQPDAGNYELVIDRMSMAEAGRAQSPGAVVTAADGKCTMRGDPMREPAWFECRVRSAGRETIARFRSDRVPAIDPTTHGAPRDLPATFAPGTLGRDSN
jgi:hypothetical protein